MVSEHESEVVQSWADHDRVGFFDDSRELREWSLDEGGALRHRVIPLPDDAPREVVIDRSSRWAGHDGTVDYVAISPDGRWVASTGDDNTLRLWPVPDLDVPPLHTLPREELIAKLQSLTNLRAVRDPDDSTGWRIELAPFPGWKEVPTW